MGGLRVALNPRATLNPQQGYPQPSTLNPQPSTLNPQPSTLNPQQSPDKTIPGGSVLIVTHARARSLSLSLTLSLTHSLTHSRSVTHVLAMRSPRTRPFPGGQCWWWPTVGNPQGHVDYPRVGYPPNLLVVRCVGAHTSRPERNYSQSPDKTIPGGSVLIVTHMIESFLCAVSGQEHSRGVSAGGDTRSRALSHTLSHTHTLSLTHTLSVTYVLGAPMRSPRTKRSRGGQCWW